MPYRLATLLLAAIPTIAFLLDPAPAAAQAPMPKKDPPSAPAPTPGPDLVKWDLSRMDQEPIKLIKATPDPRTGQVRFLLEFTRAPKPSEMYDWEARGGVVLFKFLDEDGVALRVVKPQWEGELAPIKGTRMRLVLTLPNEPTLNLTRSVVAE